MSGCEVAFLCADVRHSLAASPTLFSAPCAKPQVGVVLFADVSGFTTLGQKLRSDFTAATATEMLASAIFGALERLTV